MKYEKIMLLEDNYNISIIENQFDIDIIANLIEENKIFLNRGNDEQSSVEVIVKDNNYNLSAIFEQLTDYIDDELFNIDLKYYKNKNSDELEKELLDNLTLQIKDIIETYDLKINED